MITALIGQFNRTVRAITRALKLVFFPLLAKQNFVLLAVKKKKKSHLSARVMARTVLLNCPIKAEIRAVDSQSDLKILL